MLTNEHLQQESKNQAPPILPVAKNKIIYMKEPVKKLNARLKFLQGKLIASAQLLSPKKLELIIGPDYSSPRFRRPIRNMFLKLLKNKYFVSELSMDTNTQAGICFHIKKPAKWSGPEQLYSYMLHHGQNESFLHFSSLLMQNQLFSSVELSCGVAYFKLVPELNNKQTLKELKRVFVDKYKIDALFARYFSRPTLNKGRLCLYLKSECKITTTDEILEKLIELCSFSQIQLGGITDQVIPLEMQTDAQTSTEKYVPDEPMPRLIFSLSCQTVQEQVVQEQSDEWKKYLNIEP